MAAISFSARFVLGPDHTCPPEQQALILVGDWGVGKDILCQRMCPGFTPEDGYHMHHRNNSAALNLDASLEPILLSSMGPKPKDWAALEQQLVKLQLNILNPFDNDENVVRMTPLVLIAKDVIGLCYNVARPETLERVVHKWFPKTCHYQPTTPLVLIGCPPNNILKSLSDPDPIEASSEESNPIPSQVPSPQMVTTEQVRQAAAEIGAVASLMWVDPEDGNTNGGFSNEQENDPALDEWSTDGSLHLNTTTSALSWQLRASSRSPQNERVPRFITLRVSTKENQGMGEIYYHMKSQVPKEKFIGYLITPPIRPSTDPLDFLPHELWTHIISLAILGEESVFDEITPHLVMVMMLVSRRWEAFLIQTPMFWTNIHIRDDLHDLHADIATCLHLSQDLPLNLYITLQCAGWASIRTILYPHRSRIKALNLLYKSPFGAQSDQVHGLWMSTIRDLSPLLHLTRITKQGPVHVRWKQNGLQTMQDLVSLRECDGVRFYLESLQWKNLQQAKSLRLKGDFLTAFPVLGENPSLEYLFFSQWDPKNDRSVAEIPHRPLLCKSLVYQDTRPSFPFGLFPKLPSLQSLHISVGTKLLTHLITEVTSMPQLKMVNLDVFVREDDGFELPTISLKHSGVHTLRMKFSRVEWDHDLVDFPAIRDLTALLIWALPCIEDLCLNYIRPGEMTNFLQHEGFLNPTELQLCLIGPNEKIHNQWMPPNLTKFQLVCNSMSPLRGPPSNIKELVLRAGYINNPEAGKHLMDVLAPWPALERLELTDTCISGTNATLPFLRELKLLSMPLSITEHFTRFCKDLALSPHNHPYLESISSSHIPEWDILFIMLERRNLYSPPGVHPICKLELPNRIPKGVFDSLHSVLECKTPQRPTNFELSLNGSIEIILDLSL
ncbi:13210_t:CDS:2 [Acaulospora colombiana]|uniref:13210_t:CDS:1 n=1 Tax=Acaulospora colombiana TaxID=27376 RepID=A0ACA9MZC0_9GLOM|nr:13210_t:CDS:2 [Acaulospora colombiana]